MNILNREGRDDHTAMAAGFASLNVGADEFLASYPCNHIHGIYGDWVSELTAAADMLHIEVKIYGGKPGL